MTPKMKMTGSLLTGVALSAMVALGPIAAFAGPVYTRGEQEEYDLNDFEPGSGGGDTNYYDMGSYGGFPSFGRSGGSGGSGGGGTGGGGGGGGGGDGAASFTTSSYSGGGGGGGGGGDTTFWDPCWAGNCGSNTGGDGGTNGNTSGGNGDSVPEPLTLGLLGAGLVGLGLARRRRKQG